MAALTPSGSAGGVVEITNTSIAPAYNIVVTSLRVNPSTRISYTFPDGSTNITFRVRQLGQEVRFYSALNATGYFTTNTYSSGSVNTKQVTFCWENDAGVDVELTYWGPAGVSDSSGFLLLETGDYLGLY
jgi:hypothetical protein